MHELHLMHRDIKLLNIFLCDDSDMPRVKLGDLGLSLKIAPGEKVIKRVGTVGFMAPEVVLEEPSDLKSDIYSLGIILYILINTRLPYEADRYAESKLRKLMQMEVPFEGPRWQQANPQVVDLLKNMLKVDPEERYSIEQVCSHPWIAAHLGH